MTTSASGVDPQISFANARIQANRVAKERGLPLSQVMGLVDDTTSRPLLGLGGPKSVNVVKLNQAVSAMFGADILRSAIVPRVVPQAPPAADAAQPGHVRRRGRRAALDADLDRPGAGRSPPGGGGDPAWFTLTVAIWLWLTVLFGNFAEAIAEGRGKAQADTLRAMRTQTVARLRDGGEKPANALRRGDVVVVDAGEVIPGDGTVIEGIASVDESAITGESAPVIRESGGDRSAVTGGTRVLSDHIVVEITQEPGQSFLDRMIALVEGAERRKTPNEIALSILLAGLTLVFLAVVVTLRPFSDFAGTEISITILIALLVALIPTTIGALLSAIGIAGMDRLVRRNVLALSGRAVEASGDVDVLLLDKTGTITLGNRQAAAFIPMPGVEEAELAEAAQSRRWPTRRPRAARSSCSPSSTACASTSCSRSTRASSRSPRRRA